MNHDLEQLHCADVLPVKNHLGQRHALQVEQEHLAGELPSHK